MKKAYVITILTLFLFSSCNKTKIELAIQLEPGDKHLTEMVLDIGNSGEYGHMEMALEDEVLAVDESGTHQVHFYYRRIAMDMQGQSYDSDYPDRSQFARLMHDQMSIMMNRPISGTVSADGYTKITEDFKKWEDFNRLNPQVAQSLEESFSHRNVRFPKGEIAVGDTWNADIERTSNGVKVSGKATYKLKDVSDEEIEIEITGDIEAQNNMAVTGAMNGRIILDGQTHYPKKVDMQIDMQTGGMTIPMHIVMTTKRM